MNVRKKLTKYSGGGKRYSTLAGDAKAAAEAKASKGAGKKLVYDEKSSVAKGRDVFRPANEDTVHYMKSGKNGMKYSGGGKTGNPEEEKKKKSGSTAPSIGFSMDDTSKKEQKKLDKAEARQEEKDKKGMIPARYRNRGQAGIEAYKADMAKKRSRKNAKGLAKIFGTKAARKTAKKARQASRAQHRRLKAQRKSGCQGPGCGAYSENKY